MMPRVFITLARTKYARNFTGWLFAHMSFILPLDRLLETKYWLVFRHPQPAYPVHILFVPKKTLTNLLALSTKETDLIKELLDNIQNIIVELGLEESGYRLITNGGAYQEIPQLHFHLVSGEPFQ